MNAQLSRVFRRGIVSPLTEDSAFQLERWFIDSSVWVDFLLLEDDSLFYSIFEHGIFDSINRRCKVIIDDYEEECLETEMLAEAIAALQETRPNIKYDMVNAFVGDLIDLLQSAKNRNQPVYFIL